MHTPNTPTAPTALTLLTGASRGLGLGIAQALHRPGHRLVTISRHPAPLPHADGAALEQWCHDLAEPAPVAARLEDFLRALDPAGVSELRLIHNAAALSTPGPLGGSDSAELARALRVGLEAPLLLSAAFLRATAGWTVPRKLLFISSGLGRRAMAGSAAYCAVKAGMDHLARALALEEAAAPNGAKVVSLAPGIIDTDMQVQLRHADPEKFPERERFAAFKRDGQLDTPAQAAAKVLRVLDSPSFGSNPVTDVREAA
jgi:NAD(P)-dependent dehydrogenase (short-subunit alcohol dehydrogenase family)